MKKKRKIKVTALLLTAFLLLTGLMPGLAFAETEMNSWKVSLAPSSTEVLQGSEVIVDVVVQSDVQTVAPDAAEFRISYDTERLEYKDFESEAVNNLKVTDKDGVITLSYLTDSQGSSGYPLSEGMFCVAKLRFQASAGGTAEIVPIKAVATGSHSLKDTECETTGTMVSVKERPAPVYLDGIDGDDANDGTSETAAVKTFARAKEMLQRDGDIYIVGTVIIPSGEEATWSLPEEVYGSSKICFRQTGDKGEYQERHECILNMGQLTLENLKIEGYNGSPGTLINSSGTLIINQNVLLSNNLTNRGSGAVHVSGGHCIIRDVEIENCESASYGTVRENNDYSLDLQGGRIDGSVTFHDYRPTLTPVSDITIKRLYTGFLGNTRSGFVTVNNDARQIREVRIGETIVEPETDWSYKIQTASTDVSIKMKDQTESSLSIDKSPVYFYAGKDYNVVEGSLTTQTLTVTNGGTSPTAIRVTPEENGYFVVSQPESGSLEAGASATFTVTPDASRIQELRAGDSVSSGITVTGDDGSEVTVYAVFRLLDAYTATISCGENGSLSLDPDGQPYDQYLICEDGSAINLYTKYQKSTYPVKAGESVRLLINDQNRFGRGGLSVLYQMDSGYRLGTIRIYNASDPDGGITYDGKNGNYLGVSPYVTNENDANRDLHMDVTFVRKNCNLSLKVENSVGGRIEGPTSVEYGDNAEIRLLPEDGYHLEAVAVDGVVQQTEAGDDGVPVLKLENITTDLLVEATFAKDPAFMTHSLLLTGSIGVNFFMDLPETEGVDYRDSYMEFTINGRTQTAAFDASKKSTSSSGEYYGFTCMVNSVQMADEIRAVFHYGEGQTVEETYSVEQYVDTFAGKVAENPSFASRETQDLVAALADYGHYIQPFLANERKWTLGEDGDHRVMPNRDELTDADVEKALRAVENSAVVRETGTSGIEKVTFSLYLDSDTSLYFYLKPKADFTGDVSALIGGEGANAAEKLSDGRYRVVVPEISAHLLGTDHEIAVSADGSFTIRGSAMSYVNAMLNAKAYKDNQEARYAMTALYRYYAAAVAYKQA